ncbi:MAG: DUF4145 domain-containing protein [Candidatus Hodarchaeales archaeon]
MNYLVGEDGVCPHCNKPVNFASATAINRFTSRLGVYNKDNTEIFVNSSKCPSCNETILYGTIAGDDILFYPKYSSRKAPKEIPVEIAEDYNEACDVLGISPKASSALSRRCLQNILHDQGFTDSSLSREIDQAMKTLPPYISESIDAIRNIGNYSAHPNKDQHTGMIVPVESGEAEWSLDLLDMLFEFYYVAPERAKTKRKALNNKLSSMGKPNMKKP